MIDYDIANNIEDKEALNLLIEELINDYQNNFNEWENNNLDLYLSGMAGWILDFEGAYKNMKIEIPQNIHWDIIAEVFLNQMFCKNCNFVIEKKIKSKKDLSCQLENINKKLKNIDIEQFLKSIKHYLNVSEKKIGKFELRLIGNILKAGMIYE